LCAYGSGLFSPSNHFGMVVSSGLVSCTLGETVWSELLLNLHQVVVVAQNLRINLSNALLGGVDVVEGAFELGR